MIIIFEGLDRCGKSTQIQKLIHLFHDKSIHQLHYSSVKGFPIKEETKMYSSKMYSDMFKLLYQNYKDMHFVLDRSHIGEMVYGPMYRGYDGDYVIYIENYWKDFEEFWDQIHLITFVDKAENVIKRDDGLSFTTELDKKNKEIEAFVNATNKSIIKHKLIMNIDGKDIDTVFAEVRGFLNV